MDLQKTGGTGEARERSGRFRKGRSGNPAGRPRGSVNSATRAAILLLDGEAEALTRKAVELALAGDPAALRLCLDRIVGVRRGRPVDLTLPPIASIADLAAAMAAIAAAAAQGMITPEEASRSRRWSKASPAPWTPRMSSGAGAGAACCGNSRPSRRAGRRCVKSKIGASREPTLRGDGRAEARLRQYRALPGVRGKGIASRTLARPVE